MSSRRNEPSLQKVARVGRREALLAGLATVAGVTAGVGLGMARPWTTSLLSASNGQGIKPAGGAASQTAALQLAIDEAASSGTPLLLPPGTYRTDTLTLRPGSQIYGVPEQTILKSEGRAILTATGADSVHITGLVLDGGALPLEKNDALLAMAGAAELNVSDCRFLNSGGGGVNLREASGCITYCTFSNIADGAVYVELGFKDALIADNIVDTAATGISVTTLNKVGHPAIVQRNVIRNIFFRKTGDASGSGIAVTANTSVVGNVVEGAPAYGIVVGPGQYSHHATVTGNVVRRSHIGIGIATGSSTGTALIADNFVDRAKDGAIRAISGQAPAGPDLAVASTNVYRNVTVHGNVSA